VCILIRSMRGWVLGCSGRVVRVASISSHSVGGMELVGIEVRPDLRTVVDRNRRSARVIHFLLKIESTVQCPHAKLPYSAEARKPDRSREQQSEGNGQKRENIFGNCQQCARWSPLKAI
jgi:hypothetical protein